MAVLVASCSGGGGKDDPAGEPPPEFGTDATRAFTVVGTAADGLSNPRDLEFHPQRPDELWTVNRETDGTVVYSSPGLPAQAIDARVDAWALHFMEEVSSISFGANDTFGTCQESRNTYNGQTGPDDFMGPVLWPADPAIYATVHQSDALLGSHLDMLHQSPLCMGIAHESANVYWVFDGMNGHLVRYDFQVDHGPGLDDHSDGIVRRYVQVELTRVADVPGHMVFDAANRFVYIADTGGNRVLRVDADSGTVDQALAQDSEPLVEYSSMKGVQFEVFANGIDEPSGLHLSGGRLFVGEHGTGDLLAFDLQGTFLGRVHTPATGLYGITLGPDGKLWYVDGPASELVRLDP